MTDDQLTTEIREANMTYLMLAQNVIRKDKAEALFRLGISEESATLIATLSPAQIMKIASSPMLLCRSRRPHCKQRCDASRTFLLFFL